MKLYKHNRIDMQYELNNYDIAIKFVKSKYNSPDLLNYKSLNLLIIDYITDNEPDGLQSSYDMDGYNNFLEAQKDIADIRTILLESDKLLYK